MNFYDSSINAARGGFLTPGVRDNLYRGNSELRLANPDFNWNQIGSGLNMFGNEFFCLINFLRVPFFFFIRQVAGNQ